MSVESIAAAYRRRAYRDFLAIVGGIAAVAVVVGAVTVPPAAFLVAVAGALVLYVPAFRRRERLVLESVRDPDEERDAFAGVDCPLVAIERAWADDAEPTEAGGEFSYGFLVFRRDVRVRSERDDGLVVTVEVNDTPRETYEVSVRAADGGSRIEVSGTRESRVHLRDAVFGRIGRTYRRRALSELGYDVVEASVDLGL